MSKETCMTKKDILKRIIKITGSLAIVILVLYLLQCLLVPKYADAVVEGNFVAEYYEEEDKDFDVIFVGDCEVYENFSPVTLWREYGINSYIRGSANQFIWQSYYLLEDALRYSTPKVVVFNIQSLQYNTPEDEPNAEPYNRMTLEGMEWSKSKIDAINASMTKDESMIDYIFPILRYHSRWNELSMDDVKYMFSRKKSTHNGYYMRVDVKPATNVPTGMQLTNYDFGDNAWKYLDKMRRLCEENGITLLLIKAPSLYPYWYPQWDEQVVEYAKQYNLRYINMIDIKEEIGIDYTTDTYDAGLHMNLSGAEKCATYLGRILSEELEVPDKRTDEKYQRIWERNIEEYEAEKEAQYIKYGMK